MATDKRRLYDSAQGYIRKGNWKKALSDLEKLQATENTDPLVPHWMGDLFIKLGRRNEALKSYMSAASLFGKQGHIPKAVATYKLVMRLNPAITGVEAMIDELMAQNSKPSLPALKPKPPVKEDTSRSIELSVASEPRFEAEMPKEDASGSIGLSVVPEAGFETEGRDVPGGYGDMDFSQAEGGEVDVFGYGNIDFSKVEGAGGGVDSNEGGGGQSEFDASHFNSAPETYDSAAETYEMDAEVYGEPEAPAPQKSGLLFDLSPEETWELMGRMKRLSFEDGDAVVREGDEGDSLFVVRKGFVRVITRVNGRELVLAHLGERDFFGEVSLLTGRPRTADVVADGPVEVMELCREDLNDIMKRHPGIEECLRTFHESRVAETIASFKAVSKEYM